MKKLSILLILTLIAIKIFTNEVDTIYKDLSNFSVLEDQIAEVENFSFQRDVAEFNLTQGKLYLISPVNDKTVAAVFLGDGNVKIVPPTKVSKERLFSEFKQNQYNETFDFMFMLFTDSTLTEFSRNLDFKTGTTESNLIDKIRYCWKYIYNQEDEYYDPAILKTFLNEEQDGYFYAHLSSKNSKDEPFFFEFDPNDVEEISLGVRAKRNTIKDHYRKWFCKFHSQEDYLSGVDLTFERKDEIEVDKFIIDATITKGMDFSANCTIEFHGLENTGNWLDLYMFKRLRIKSIITAAGDSLEFFKEDDSSILWVDMVDDIKVGNSYKISIEYDGDLIYRGGSVVKNRTYDLWYPQFSSNKYNHFDITYHFPSNYDLVSVGEKMYEEKEKKVSTSRWVTKHPVNYAPFNMGKFKEEEFCDERIPTLSLHLNKGLKNAKADVANSIVFYQEVYGKCNFDTITVAEIPRILSGEAYPGMINLYSDEFLLNPVFKVYTDLNITENDFAELRSHEIAHQWWGCSVQPRTYRDRWLAEGFAEFSSIWYLQTSVDNQYYFECLDKWRRVLIDKHKSSIQEGYTECPVWLGYRAPYYISYYKGGWIVHMLRNLMIDLKTFDESTFKAMMKDFYSTYKDATASTEDFKKIVEKHINSDMTWFFDQWVYGNELPKMKYDYDIIEKEDGKFTAVCNITQQNVSENFRSYIPIEIDFGNNQKYRLRTVVEGSGKEFEIALPMKPKKINFNIFDSVLCEE
jgi:Peptidase family M1 domain